MVVDIAGNGKLLVSDSPICDKYYTTGVINGFLTKEDIQSVLKEHNLSGDLGKLSSNSEDVIVWDLNRTNTSSKLHVFADVDGNIVEAQVSISFSCSKLSLLNENVSGIKALKLKSDVQSIIEKNNEYLKELDRLDATTEGVIRTAINDEIGDIAILAENIDISNGEAYIPIGLGDKDWKSPVVLARVKINEDGIDLSDVEDKVCHLLATEDGLKRIGKRVSAKIRNKADMNYRKYRNNGGSLDKSTMAGKSNLDSKVKPNRGRKKKEHVERPVH